MPTTYKPLPWFFRSPVISVPANGTANYTVDITQSSGTGEEYYRKPCVVVSVEGSTTVKAATGGHTITGFVVTLRNEMNSTQAVRFNAATWDAYAGDFS